MANYPKNAVNPLVRKLGSFADLASEDVAALESLGAASVLRHVRRDLIKEGDRPDTVFLLLEGWACRYKILPDGRRQIMAYLIPGDLCDIHIFILRRMDHSIGLLSEAMVASIPKNDMLAMLRNHPRIAQALLWATLVDEGTLREWLVNLGQRDAYERLAHLFCELWLRLSQVGLVNGNTFGLPLTQEQLGDTLGLTSVHVNRVLQRMRTEGLVTIAGKRLTIENGERLRQISGFNPNYLHLDRRQ